METLTHYMRYAVLNIARHDKQKAESKIESYLQTAYKTLSKDELEEFLREVVVLEQDIGYLSCK